MSEPDPTPAPIQNHGDEPAPISPAPHRRRPRYAGKNPRRFADKYKELNPERYAADVAKVLAAEKRPRAVTVPSWCPKSLRYLHSSPEI